MKAVDVRAFSKECRACRSPAISSVRSDPAVHVSLLPDEVSPGALPRSNVTFEPAREFICNRCGYQWEEVIRTKS